MTEKNKKTLILDCDGVLYPISDITLSDFVEAVRVVAQERNISEEEYDRVSKKALNAKEKGLFNFIHNLCDKDEKSFNDYTNRVSEVLDYSKITRDDELFYLIKQTQKKHNVVVLTNNTTTHLEKVFEKRFDKKAEELGFESYGIEFLKRNDKFYPKQTELGLKMFTKKLGLNPKDCTLVEDTQRNLDVAKEVGMSGVLVDENYTLKKYLYSLQDSNMVSRTRENEYK